MPAIITDPYKRNKVLQISRMYLDTYMRDEIPKEVYLNLHELINGLEIDHNNSRKYRSKIRKAICSVDENMEKYKILHELIKLV